MCGKAAHLLNHARTVCAGAIATLPLRCPTIVFSATPHIPPQCWFKCCAVGVSVLCQYRQQCIQYCSKTASRQLRNTAGDNDTDAATIPSRNQSQYGSKTGNNTATNLVARRDATLLQSCHNTVTLPPLSTHRRHNGAMVMVHYCNSTETIQPPCGHTTGDKDEHNAGKHYGRNMVTELGIVRLQYRKQHCHTTGNTTGTILAHYRHNADTVLTQYHRSSATIPPQYRHTRAAILGRYGRNTAVMLSQYCTAATIRPQY